MALTFKELPFQLVEPPGSGWHAERKRFKVGYGTDAYREVMRPIPPTIPAIIAKWEDGSELKLNESSTIIEWLDEATPSLPKLFPGNPEARARLRLAIRVHDLSLDSKVRSLFGLIDPAKRDSDDAREKIESISQALFLISTHCDSYATDSASDEFFNGIELTAVDCTLFPTFLLIDKILSVIQEGGVKWPGVRLPKWYASFAKHQVARAVMSEAAASIDDWVRRKGIGQDSFTDGWWRPENYGGKKNASFPAE